MCDNSGPVEVKVGLALRQIIELVSIYDFIKIYNVYIWVSKWSM